MKKLGRTEHERQLTWLVEHTVHPIYIKDLDGVYQFVNDATASYFDLEPQQIVGRNDAELFDGPLDDVNDGDAQVLATGEAITMETSATIDGQQRVFLDNKYPYFDQAGALAGVMGISQDITARKQHERELERTRHLLQQSEQLAGVGGWELVVTADGPSELHWSDEVYRIHDLPPDAEVSVDDAIKFYHAVDQPRVRAAVESALESGVPYDVQARLVTAAGRERWVSAIGDPVMEGGRVVAVRGSVQDITEQKERELVFESLHQATLGLLQANEPAEAAELLVAAVESALDVSVYCIYLFDEETNRLEPTAHSRSFAAYCDGDPVGFGPADDSPLWESFVTDEVTRIDATDGKPLGTPFVSAVEHGLVVPIGTHGVFAAASASEPIDTETGRLIETLAATAEEAISRIQSEAHLRERDARLEEQNEQLRRQIRINDTIRSVDQSLIGATNRAALEATVCEQLVDSPDIEFAWVGEFDRNSESVVPRTWAGEDHGYLARVALDVSESVREPAVETVVDGTATVVANVGQTVQREPWRREALAANFQSVLAAPLAFDDYSYGVLAVYACAPRTFGELEGDVFTELGESIANAIASASTKQALQADTAVSLTLHVEAPSDILSGVARGADCTVSYVGLSTHDDDAARLFFRASGTDAQTVAAALETLHTVEGYQLVSETSEASLFEVTHSGTSIVTKLARHGGYPRSVTADATGLVVEVEVPVSADVREFVGMLDEDYDVELIGRHEVDRLLQTRQGVFDTVLGDLTDRQLEVLQTAYLAGFFNWPRDTTGEELAAMLDVSQPTVNRHIRVAERRIMDHLFDSDAESAS